MAVDYQKTQQEMEQKRAKLAENKYQFSRTQKGMEQLAYDEAMRTPGKNPAVPDSSNPQSSHYVKPPAESKKDEPIAKGNNSSGIISNESSLEKREKNTGSNRNTGVKVSDSVMNKQRTTDQSQASRYASGVRSDNKNKQTSSSSSNKNTQQNRKRQTGQHKTSIEPEKTDQTYKESKVETSKPEKKPERGGGREEHIKSSESHSSNRSFTESSKSESPRTDAQSQQKEEASTKNSQQENKRSEDPRQRVIGDATSLTGYAGLSEEQQQQILYNKMMKGQISVEEYEKSSMDQKVNDQFRNVLEKNNGKSDTQSIHEGGQGDRNKHIKSTDEKASTGIKSDSVPVVFGGGKSAGGAFRNLNTKVVTNQKQVNTNALSIFSNPELAKKCGVLFDPASRKMKIVSSSGSVERKDIAKSLMDEGYTPQAAYQYADAAVSALNSNMNSSNAERITESENKEEDYQVKIKSSNGNKEESLNVRVVNNNFMVYRPTSEKFRNIGVKAERGGHRLYSTVYHYSTGQFQSSTQEAGRGIGNYMQAARIAQLTLPQMSVHVNHVLQQEIKKDLNNHVTFKIGKNHVETTVGEVKSKLLSLGINENMVNECQVGDDFSVLGKKLLKHDQDPNLPIEEKLTNEQKDFLNTISKARTSTKDDRIQSLNTVLNKYGISMNGDYGHATVTRLQKELKNAIKKYGGIQNVPPDLLNALNEGIKFAKNNTYANVKGKKLMLAAFIAKGQLEKNGGDAGKGLSTLTRAGQVSKMTVKLYVQVQWQLNILVREAAQKAMLFMAKGALAAARRANSMHLNTVSKALNKVGNAGEKSAKAVGKANDFANNFGKNTKRKTSEWIHKHNPLSFARRKVRAAALGAGRKIASTSLYRKFMASKVGRAFRTFGRGASRVKGFTSRIIKGLANTFRKIGHIFSVIKHYLFIGCLIILVVWLLCLAINQLMVIVGSLFDTNAQEYDTKQYLAEQLETYWKDDMQYVFDIKDDLQNGLTDEEAMADPDADRVISVKFIFEDFKHYSKDDVGVSHPEDSLKWMREFNYEMVAEDFEAYDYTQSSNNGEILSMAMVRHDMDLGKLKNNWFSDNPIPNKQLQKVDKYVKQLYYGSHELVVEAEAQAYASDLVEDGELVDEETDWSHVEYELTATYKTYYFNYLFDCLLYDEPRRTYIEPVIPEIGSTVGYVEGWDSIYYALRMEGITHEGAAGIMSNLAHESADRHNWQAAPPNPTAGPPTGPGPYGICQWTSSGDRKANMISWCQSKGYDYASTSGQLAYMIHEINDINAYTPTKHYVYESGHSAYDCANKFGDNFERYGGGEEASRGNLAEEIAAYYAKYKDADEEELSELYNLGQKIADYAMKSVGKIHYTQGSDPYIGSRVTSLNDAYDGFSEDPLTTLPTAGMDCSAFVHACYKEAGMSGTPTTTGGYSSMSSKEVPVEQASPGDVMWKPGHVAVCVGNGKTVELKTCYFQKTGSKHKDVCTSDCSMGEVASFVKAYRLWK